MSSSISKSNSPLPITPEEPTQNILEHNAENCVPEQVQKSTGDILESLYCVSDSPERQVRKRRISRLKVKADSSEQFEEDLIREVESSIGLSRG
jgi:hypothetical protein